MTPQHTSAKLRIDRYTAVRAVEWNEFVERSKNGPFLFNRGYMDYHADRFVDHSLMFYRPNGELAALLPACEGEGGLVSHAGLTFGGVISDRRMRTGTIVDLFACLRGYMRDRGFAVLLYKPVPHIYHQIPAGEDLYALFVHGARLVRRDVASTVDLRDRVEYTKGRKWSTKKALGCIDVRETRDLRQFMAIEENHLQTRFGVRPVHSQSEIELLSGRFPNNIRLFAGFVEDRMLGGVLIYQSQMVAHAQYISSTDEGRSLGCLDAVMAHLLNRVYPGILPYFDFGISTEKGGMFLNRGLADNKESYGGRAVTYDFYELAAAGDES